VILIHESFKFDFESGTFRNSDGPFFSLAHQLDIADFDLIGGLP